jgi:hypothetical protein
MNPQQKQMLNMMYASTAKTEEDLNKMTPEEKKEYLRSRLHQKMNIGGLQRRTNFQKTQIQEKLQSNAGESEEKGEEAPKAKSKSAKKNEKERMKKLAELLQNQGVQQKDFPEEVKRIKSESESDYESDKDEN